ncbi:MAG: molybdopterin biosynthesis protein, partial [Bacilli bacterium]
DGIALAYELTLNASINNPLILSKEQYQKVNTGAIIDSGANCVIMKEDLSIDLQGNISINQPAHYFQNIRPIGEDIALTQMILPSYHRIKAVDMSVINASFNDEIPVFKKLNIAIMTTGSELVSVSLKSLEPGDIIDSNSSLIKGLVLESKHNPIVYPSIKDDYDQLKAALIKASHECDIILINAGTSAGSKDYTAPLIKELGEVIVHGISIKPGKPAILGLINNKMVIGLPGYPVSAYMVYMNVLKPILNKLYHQNSENDYLPVKLTTTIHSSLKHLEFVRIKIGYVNNEFVATPLARGAGMTSSLLEADGIIEIAQAKEGLLEGSIVQALLLKPQSSIKQKLVALGSHDLIIDVLNDFSNQFNYQVKINSTHVGSYAGLLALVKKEANLAFTHILDEAGTYNKDIITKLFNPCDLYIIKGVKRSQGLVVAKNNPLNISSLKDLINNKYKYVNRQQGSGTNMLLHYLLKQENLKQEDLIGYDFIMPTHYNVASCIKSNLVDAGLAIYSVAQALDLGYVEITLEDYDIIIYKEDLNDYRIQGLIRILRNETFKNELAQLGGYDTSLSGQIFEIRENEFYEVNTFK